MHMFGNKRSVLFSFAHLDNHWTDQPNPYVCMGVVGSQVQHFEQENKHNTSMPQSYIKHKLALVGCFELTMMTCHFRLPWWQTLKQAVWLYSTEQMLHVSNLVRMMLGLLPTRELLCMHNAYSLDPHNPSPSERVIMLHGAPSPERFL